VRQLGWQLWGRGTDEVENITEDVATRSLDLVVTATGNLRPTNQVDVGSETSGKIDAILVDVNDRVVRGQVLARINTDLINDQITQGRASVNAARAAGIAQRWPSSICAATIGGTGSRHAIGSQAKSRTHPPIRLYVLSGTPWSSE